MAEAKSVWTEEDSRAFIDIADVAVPGRREQVEMLLSLVPSQAEEPFLAAELCCGEAVFAEQLLERFSSCRLLALDGSPVMLESARRRLGRFGDRAELRQFDLDSGDWVSEMPGGFRCVFSSLALHHIDADAKRQLFRELGARLEPGGALLIADIIEPVSGLVQRAMDSAWQRIAREQSLVLSGSLELYQRAVDEGWAPGSEEPDGSAEETPSRLFDQLKWLAEAGFAQVDCFWMRAGIAIYGGYR